MVLQFVPAPQAPTRFGVGIDTSRAKATTC